MSQVNKSTSAGRADFWFNFYLLVITLPATVFAIGIEYKTFNCSFTVMAATAILIASPNLYFFLRAKKCWDECDEYEYGPSDLTILVAFFSFVFSLFAGITFFLEDHYESFTMSKADFSVFLLNKYNPGILPELEKLNNQQLITVRRLTSLIPEDEDGFDRRSSYRTNKIKAGIALYCNARLSKLSDAEYERLQNRIFVEQLKKSLNAAQINSEISSVDKRNDILLTNNSNFADIIRIAKAELE